MSEIRTGIIRARWGGPPLLEDNLLGRLFLVAHRPGLLITGLFIAHRAALFIFAFAFFVCALGLFAFGLFALGFRLSIRLGIGFLLFLHRICRVGRRSQEHGSNQNSQKTFH